LREGRHRSRLRRLRRAEELKLKFAARDKVQDKINNFVRFIADGRGSPTRSPKSKKICSKPTLEP
jgi:hypothetical protein